MDNKTIDLFERLAYDIAEEACRESKRALTEEMVRMLPLIKPVDRRPKVKIAGGGK